MGTTFILIFLCIVLFRLSINGYYFIKTRTLRKKYGNWIYSRPKDYSMSEKKAEIIFLWENAGIKDLYLPRVEPVGYGQLATGKVSLFTSFPSVYEDMAGLTIRVFHEAEGVYIQRTKEAINPIAWVILMVNLPEKISKALGFAPSKGLSNFLKGIWWIFSIFCAFILATYPTEIRAIFEHLMFGK